MGKMANKEELAEDMLQMDRKRGKVEDELAQLQDQLADVDQANQKIEAKIDVVYDRQREVTIGKRNINCLSCAVEPERRAVQGRDGQVYRGVSPQKTQEEQMMESRTRPGGSSESKIRGSKLLNLKWDAIGLQ